MKNLFLPALLLTALSANAQNPEIKNNTFSVWEEKEFSISSTEKITINYPKDWSSSDLAVARDAGEGLELAGLTLTNQTFEVAGLLNSEGKAVEIRTIALDDSTFLPGILTNGEMELDLTEITAGSKDIEAIIDAFSLKSSELTHGKKIDSIKVVIKTGAANVEGTFVQLAVFKEYGDSTDLIGLVRYPFENLADSVQTIVIPVEYEDSNSTVGDHFNVAFLSSPDHDVDTFTTGNSLTIGQVELYFSEVDDTTTSIVQPLLGNTLAVYPNPATNNVHFNLQAGLNPADYSLAIFDQLGRAVYARQLSEVFNTISVSNWNAGIYTYQLISGAKAVKTGQIVVK